MWNSVELRDLLGGKGYIRGPFGSALRRNEMQNTGIPVYEQKNAIYNSREFRYFIDEEKFNTLKRFQVQTSDLIISCSGTVGKVSIIGENDPKGIISQALLILRPDTAKVIEKYLFYFLNSKLGYKLITQVSHGSVQVNIAKRNVVEGIKVPLPPVVEQESIVEVLSSLDDKIELLQKQNETLEALAQTLFRQWFIEEADDSWEEVEISKELTITIGKTPPRKESHWFSNTEGIPWLSIKDMGQQGIYINNTTEYLTKEAVDTHNVKVVPAESVLMSFKLTVGRVAINHQDMVTNEAIAHFYGFEQSRLTNYYVYLFLKQFNFRSLGSTSSIAQAVNSKTVKSIKIPVPHSELMAEFTKTVEGLFEKIKLNTAQIQTIEQTRDTLLPKLMSGQVRVKLD